MSAALAHHRAGRLVQAKRGYEEVLATHPEHADSLHLLGVIAHQSGNSRAAADLIGRAIRVNDRNPHFHNNLGEACRALGRAEDAVGHYERALALDPGYADASCNLGTALLELGHADEALAAYDRGLHLSRASGAATSANQDSFRRTTSAKLRHDIGQLAYLMDQGLLPEDFEHTIATYREALTDLEPRFAQHYIADIPPALAAKLAPTYNRLIHYRAPAALARPAIRSTLDRAAVESDYFRNAPGITWIDNLLDQEALDALYRFCLDSTIWFKFDYENGYLAAVMGEGFFCPLLAQIAYENRRINITMLYGVRDRP